MRSFRLLRRVKLIWQDNPYRRWKAARPVACSSCFTDRGLRLDAERLGREGHGRCPNCGATGSRKLSVAGLEALAHRFFVWGSLLRAEYGAAPVIQFNQHQTTSIEVAESLKADVELFERTLAIGFFYYGPRLWMVGEVEPLKALQHSTERSSIVARLLREYPAKTLEPTDTFYRIRVNPAIPADPQQYDSPPPEYAGMGRLDSRGRPVLYGSPDLQVCVHECRVAAEDDVFVATLAPTSSLRLLNLAALLDEDDGITEFESLDMAVHMLFLAGKHSYEVTREISIAAQNAGFDGIVFPSYFSLLRLGQMPFQTVYGISHRRIPELRRQEEAKSVPNVALFGRPVSEGRVRVQCIDRVIVSRVAYEFHFGPALREEDYSAPADDAEEGVDRSNEQVA